MGFFFLEYIFFLVRKHIVLIGFIIGEELILFLLIIFIYLNLSKNDIGFFGNFIILLFVDFNKLILFK